MASPTLLVSQEKVLANLQKMAERAKRHGLDFRPHFKTHQSLEVAEWVKAMGVKEISVTSLRMAHDFADMGWDGITIAMPLNVGVLPEINALAEKVKLTVFINNEYAALAFVEQAAPTIRCFTEVDTGYGRSGVNFEDEKTLKRLLDILGPSRFRGYYAHSGHTYDTSNLAEITEIHHTLLSAIQHLRALDSTPADCEFAIGDTPACSTQEHFEGVTSIGPGNFIFYDLKQASLNACTTSDIAVCLAAPVLEVNDRHQSIILHAGWVQLGKDQLHDGTYGTLVQLNADHTWRTDKIIGKMTKLSQEHGTARVAPEWLKMLKPGDLVGILPVHACAAVHGMRALGSRRIIPSEPAHSILNKQAY